MIWQDYAITLIVWMFVVATIPLVKDTIKGNTSVNLLTAVSTSIGNYGIALIFSTIGLWISIFSGLSIATLWLVIFIFSWRNK